MCPNVLYTGKCKDSLNFVSGFEKGVTSLLQFLPVFRWLILGQTLMKLNESFWVKYLIFLLAVYEVLEPWY